jgi:NADH-quinone oxidoreductase subunit J
MHVSGLFIILNAEFLWAVQVIVYVGAILVLYLFVLMLLNLKTDERYFHSSALYILGPAVLGAGYVLYLLLRSPFAGAKGDSPATAVLQDGDTYAVGIKMFSDHLLQFEIVGIFLLGAIIGAIVLAKTPKQLDADRERL